MIKEEAREGPGNAEREGGREEGRFMINLEQGAGKGAGGSSSIMMWFDFI